MLNGMASSRMWEKMIENAKKIEESFKRKDEYMYEELSGTAAI